ncbi:GGDEF domain-containing protein [Psychromonas hadalis]|uniref:GGDEF domain-containing protein n=1 Tax=Psychromonas hadalis TaxID=211669 RepID=UPI0003B65105|nr:GGDEF domain-containing protein [Psychromonas hadalis]
MEKYNQNTQENRSEPLSLNSEKQKKEEKKKDTTSIESSAFSQVMSQMNIADLNAFDLRYKKLWQQASEDKETLSVLICKIDDFKAYNEHYGHQAAAFMLLVIALELKKKSEQCGFFLARYKADKFVILMKGTDFKKVEEIAESLRQNVEQSKTKHEFSKVNNIVTLSIGISYIYPTSMDLLMKEADSALSVAQISGNKHVSLPLVSDEIKEKISSPLDPIITSSSFQKTVNIKNDTKVTSKKSQTIINENKKEKCNEEAEIISCFKGVKPASDKLDPLQDKKSNEKVDMLSRLKNMISSSDKLDFQKKDKFTDEVDMISQLKGITPSSGNVALRQAEKSNQKVGMQSQLKNIASDKLGVKQEEQSNYEELKAELEKLKQKSETDIPPPIRYY